MLTYSEFLVTIVDVNDREHVLKLSDNDCAVRSASWDPSGQYLITAGCDGKLKVYDTSGATPFNKRNIEGMIRSSEPDAETSCYVSWHPSGNYFAVPLRTNDVGLVARDTWSKLGSFSADGHTEPVSELAWSPNGKYLASAAGSQLLVWATDGRHVVSRYNYADGAVSGLAWSPTSNMIAFAAVDGSFNRWTEPVPADLASPFLSDAALARKTDKLLDDEDDLFGDDEKPEDLDEVGEDIADELGDDWLVDDDGMMAEEDAEDKWAAGRTQVVNVTKAQASFVPGATAWRSKKRYLAFNMIGVVDATDQETHNVVNVEFHDRSARRGYHFSDHSKYTMASLGEQGIAYAAPTGDDNALSVVHYRPYDSWASSADWSVSLLPGEDALSVAVGGPESGLGTVVVATSKGMVRFFTASGVQRYVWRLGEEVITLAAGRDALLVVHREGGTSLDGCQNLRYTLLDLETFDMVQEGRVPLPKKTTLAWVGFTSAGVPVIYDSTGVLSALDRFRKPNQARWVPLFDAEVARGAKAQRESYWPVGVSDDSATLHAIILRGIDREPSFPRPLLQDLELQMPLLGVDNAQGALEERVARNSVLLSADAEGGGKVAIDKGLLQLVQGACKADALARALDLTRLMHSTSTLDAARKIADFYHLPGLSERIARVKADKGRERGSWIDAAPQPEYTTRPKTQGRASREFGDFTPASRKRTFGGKVERGSPRASTPIMPPSSRTVIPETPGPEDEEEGMEESESMEPFDSTAGKTFDESLPSMIPHSPPKRKRQDESEFEFAKPAPPNNPFAKRAANPFAKAAVARPLDSIKSTSFFDRVEDIEANETVGLGNNNNRKGEKREKRDKKGGKEVGGLGPKQTTLFGGMSKRPQVVAKDSFLSSTTTEGGDDGDEYMQVEDRREVLEETVVQEEVIHDSADEETLVD